MRGARMADEDRKLVIDTARDPELMPIRVHNKLLNTCRHARAADRRLALRPPAIDASQALEARRVSPAVRPRRRWAGPTRARGRGCGACCGPSNGSIDIRLGLGVEVRPLGERNTNVPDNLLHNGVEALPPPP